MVSPNGAQSLPLGTLQGKSCNFNNLPCTELLKDVISIDEMQFHHNPSCSSSAASSLSSSSSVPLLFGNFDTLNGAMSKRTSDDVDKQSVQIQQQLIGTLGDTSVIESFLARGGGSEDNRSAVVDNVQQSMVVDQMIAAPQQADWLQFQLAPVQQQQQQQITMVDSGGYCPVSEYENSVLDVGYSKSKVCSSMPALPLSTSDSQAAVAAGEKRRRWYLDDWKEKSIEKRQKRMIKNRESAARSRARKQAHTSRLEQEAYRLRKLNAWLKERKEMDIHLSASQNTDMPHLKYQLRRTSSATF